MRQTQVKVFSKTVKGKESSFIPKALLDLMQRDVLYFHSEAQGVRLCSRRQLKKKIKGKKKKKKNF